MSSSDKTAQQLTDIAMIIKQTTMKAMCCAEVGQVLQMTDDVVCMYKCELLTNASITVMCDAIKEAKVSVGSRVLIIFCDTDFRNSLRKLRLGYAADSGPHSAELHSSSYGLIIGTI